MEGTRRRQRADLDGAFEALVAALRQAEKALSRRPRQLAEMDRAIASLHSILLLSVAPGRCGLIDLVERHETQLAALETHERRIEALEAALRTALGIDHRPGLRSAGGGR